MICLLVYLLILCMVLGVVWWILTMLRIFAIFLTDPRFPTRTHCSNKPRAG